MRYTEGSGTQYGYVKIRKENREKEGRDKRGNEEGMRREAGKEGGKVLVGPGEYHLENMDCVLGGLCLVNIYVQLSRVCVTPKGIWGGDTQLELGVLGFLPKHLE